MLDCVTVMAGGVGSRLWPASHQACPKQFLPLGGKSLLERTLDRAIALNPKLILVVAPCDQLPLLRACSRRFSQKLARLTHFLLEPEGRNTAPALALASTWLQQRGLLGGQLVLTADHLIQPVDAFVAAVEQAEELAARHVVVFGIPPRYPETGYGYMEKGAVCQRGFLVQRFIEKPDEESARQLLASKRYFWNSGMFCYTTGFFLEQLAHYAPEMLTPLRGVSWVADEAQPQTILPSSALTGAYSLLPKLSIDYALMERSDQVAMVEAVFDWNDIGSWDALAALDQQGELKVPSAGQVCELASSNNYVRTQQPVALCGVDDLIVVEANGQLLICRRGASQLVKQVSFPADGPSLK